MNRIVIDPGHGGKDPGAVGNGLREKDISLEISRRLAEILSGYQVEVTLTRNSDVYLGLAQRCALANNLGARYFCSIHVNAGGGTGFESYIYSGAKGETEVLRNVLHSKVAAYFQNAGFKDRGKKKADFYVLKKTKMPAVLLENLFIDHGIDSLQLKSASFLGGLAEAIARGLAAALGLKPKAGPAGKASPIHSSHKGVETAAAHKIPNNYAGLKHYVSLRPLETDSFMPFQRHTQ
ncbi:MAG: Sporulation-specific N-acetylmuramoyl-L-alanine amidase [Firmicutes bacterium ADurb.Bin456]|nr:MAG: Sporulation-specific N-acetylmuramoyl-L-alanine amidase [Firmicutes bacterium ADurb.Bin456]